MSDLQRIVDEARAAIAATTSIADLEQAKARFLGKSGSLTEQLKSLGKLSADERPKAGAAINDADDLGRARPWVFAPAVAAGLAADRIGDLRWP